MSTCVTDDVLNAHVFLCGIRVSKLPHGGVLPRVLTSIQKEDIVTSDVQTAIVLIRSIGHSLHFTTEDSLAKIVPIIKRKGLGTHRLLSIWSKEEAKLIAVLVCPLALGRVDIDFSFG